MNMKKMKELKKMKLSDNGQRTIYESGGMREEPENKGRCDLLPLELIGVKYNMPVLVHIERYIRNGDTEFLWWAIDSMMEQTDWTVYTMLIDVAKHYEAGAKKYADRNWELGIPLHSYISSAVRHYLKWMNGDTDEPHDRAFVWNCLGAIWTQINRPEYIDLPFRNPVEIEEQISINPKGTLCESCQYVDTSFTENPCMECLLSKQVFPNYKEW